MRKLVVWGGVGSAVVLAAFVAWGWIGGKDSGWWGAAGQWLGAVGSILAVGIALYLADLGRREAEKQRKADEKIQARLIFGEYQPNFGLVGEVVVVNRSGGHILDPEVMSLSTDSRYGVGEWFVGPADGEVLDHFPRVIAGELEARRRSSALNVFFKTGLGVQQATPEVQPTAMIRFFDADGRGWTRRGRAEPERWYPEENLVELLPPDDEPSA
ncbi:hypothetical protein [Amycolatopsis vastitatis]|nr:hypothetical protein [Amycolatopsis vastitatis]